MRALVAMLAAIATWGMAPAVAHAAFPGTNGNLAFGSARSGYPADNDLYTMANNGTAQTRITSHEPGRAESFVVSERHRDRVRAQQRAALRHLDCERQRHEPAPADHPSRQRHTAGVLQHGHENRVRKRPQQHVGHIRPLRHGRERSQPGRHHEHPDDQRGLPGLVARRDRDRVLARRRHLQGFAQRRQPHALDDQSRSRSSSRIGRPRATRSSSVRASTATTSSGRSTRTAAA